MGKKTIIITDRQLREVLGGDATYLDAQDKDTREYSGHNEITANGIDAEPQTADNFGQELGKNTNWWINNSRHGIATGTMVLCSKEKFTNMTLDELNQGLQNMNITSVVKSNGEPVEKIQGNEAMLAQRKHRAKERGDKDEYQAITNTLKARREVANRQKKMRKEILGEPMVKPHNRITGNGQGHN